jgi:hypothetical protein
MTIQSVTLQSMYGAFHTNMLEKAHLEGSNYLQKRRKRHAIYKRRAKRYEQISLPASCTDTDHFAEAPPGGGVRGRKKKDETKIEKKRSRYAQPLP